jgi:hypothetical protein
MSHPVLTCRPVNLPESELVPAAQTAVKINPANAPNPEQILHWIALLADLINRFREGTGDSGSAPKAPVLKPEHLAVMTSKYWGPKGVRLTVQFLDKPTASLKKRLLLHMSAWGKTANVKFTQTSSHGQVRIARNEGDGYWSYLGTDVLHIPAGQPTMNLDSFTDQTPDSEFYRVVRHETGHTLGFPHEHLRAALIKLLDPQKTIAYFQRTYGWNAQTTTEQVLTPISEALLFQPTPADALSIMCYQLAGDCTRSGEPIPGGTDIDKIDANYAARIYPKK